MIDKKKALDDFQITEKDYDEMLVEFIAQADDSIIRIEATLREGAIVEAERFAHSLKGVAGNLRLEACYLVASEIDAVLKKGPPVFIDQLLSDLRKTIDEIRASILT
jgi:two-component system, sensor histidine kinase and response regulator